MIIYGKTPSDWKNEIVFQVKENKFKVMAFVIYSAILISI
jgi:hypothetical protein|tara:strand:+ start:431 stop:550 length:120 start_codon:yes stop_codon:yes gene_type:complete